MKVKEESLKTSIPFTAVGRSSHWRRRGSANRPTRGCFEEKLGRYFLNRSLDSFVIGKSPSRIIAFGFSFDLDRIVFFLDHGIGFHVDCLFWSLDFRPSSWDSWLSWVAYCSLIDDFPFCEVWSSSGKETRWIVSVLFISPVFIMMDLINGISVWIWHLWWFAIPKTFGVVPFAFH